MKAKKVYEGLQPLKKTILSDETIDKADDGITNIYRWGHDPKIKYFFLYNWVEGKRNPITWWNDEDAYDETIWFASSLEKARKIVLKHHRKQRKKTNEGLQPLPYNILTAEHMRHNIDREYAWGWLHPHKENSWKYKWTQQNFRSGIYYWDSSIHDEVRIGKAETVEEAREIVYNHWKVKKERFK